MFYKSILGFFFFLSCGLFAHDNFHEEIKFAGDVCKIQVSLSDTFIREDGMYYLCKNRQMIPISGLQFEAGSYVATTPRGIIEDTLGVWWCYTCQHWNSRFDTSCQYCSRPRPK